MIAQDLRRIELFYQQELGLKIWLRIF